MARNQTPPDTAPVFVGTTTGSQLPLDGFYRINYRQLRWAGDGQARISRFRLIWGRNNLQSVTTCLYARLLHAGVDDRITGHRDRGVITLRVTGWRDVCTLRRRPVESGTTWIANPSGPRRSAADHRDQAELERKCYGR